MFASQNWVPQFSSIFGVSLNSIPSSPWGVPLGGRCGKRWWVSACALVLRRPAGRPGRSGVLEASVGRVATPKDAGKMMEHVGNMRENVGNIY